ncbi:helix-turn-helix domain-containing protein [Streptomyces sp. B6B3]|uniref:helix-turn-helix domain-containing protein n=1 Tax=Streptomyces sp. B6B3 TaxID=3153570 RepID=UPI00325DCF56
MLRIHFTGEDLVGTRVAPSADPLWEILLSLHVLQRPAGQRPNGPWRRQLNQRLLAANHAEWIAPTRKLLPLAPVAGYNPDFLTPIQGLLGLEEAIATILATPEDRLHRELRLLAEAGHGVPADEARSQGAPAFLASLAEALRRYHRLTLAPFWSHVQTLVRTDRAVRERHLLEGGVELLLARMGPRMHWTRPVLRVDYPNDRDVHLGGRGLLLVPSYFCEGTPVGPADPTLPPVLVYRVDRSGARPATRGARQHLASLLGATRAAVLMAATTTRSTTALARLIGVSIATASYHLSVLRDADLVSSRRQANVVHHTVTPLGLSLLNGVEDPSTHLGV